MRTAIVFLAFSILGASPALAGETISYTYDALGRLIAVAHSGTVNNGTQTTYMLDAAGNRKSMTTTGAVNLVVVVPLNGLSVIPITKP